MRFMMLMIPGGYAETAPDVRPGAEAVEGMMRYNEELKKAGVLLALDGLHPPSEARGSASRAASPSSPTARSRKSQGSARRLLGHRRALAKRPSNGPAAAPAGENDVIEVARL